MGNYVHPGSMLKAGSTGHTRERSRVNARKMGEKDTLLPTPLPNGMGMSLKENHSSRSRMSLKPSDLLPQLPPRRSLVLSYNILPLLPHKSPVLALRHHQNLRLLKVGNRVVQLLRLLL